jgi:centromeric protein E
MTGTATAPGIIPLAVKECFEYLQTQEQSPREYLLRVSYLEVYKEHIRDLLVPSSAAPPPVRLFESTRGELIIQGLTETVVTTPDQVFGILAQGEARRQTGATFLNQHSSRSHTLVRLWIESKEMGDKKTRISTLSLVDLAGSESVRLSGSNERRQEG